MNLRWTSISVLLVLGSGIAFYLLSDKVDQRKQQIAAYQAKFRLGDDEYCRQYNQWLKLPLDQQFKQMWGTGQYGKTANATERRQRQWETLMADMEDLTTHRKQPSPFGDATYGPGWQDRLDTYVNETQRYETGLFASKIGLAVGMLLFTGSLLSLTSGRLTKRRTTVKKKKKPPSPAKPPARPLLQLKPNSQNSLAEISGTSQATEAMLKECWTQGRDPVLKPYKARPLKPIVAPPPTKDQSVVTKKPPQPHTKKQALPPTPQAIGRTSVDKSTEENLGKLTTEIAALREFAAAQQDRVRKLQDGYDWNILKNFCMRIIRCIDNLDDRISQTDQPELRDSYLLDVRDELVFALESSGVEQFQPDLHADYRGQEKHLEVIKERKPCDDPELADTIAQVVRPGYRYDIGDGQIKIVRAAQVSLFQLNMVATRT